MIDVDVAIVKFVTRHYVIRSYIRALYAARVFVPDPAEKLGSVNRFVII